MTVSIHGQSANPRKAASQVRVARLGIEVLYDPDAIGAARQDREVEFLRSVMYITLSVSDQYERPDHQPVAHDTAGRTS